MRRLFKSFNKLGLTTSAKLMIQASALLIFLLVLLVKPDIPGLNEVARYLEIDQVLAQISPSKTAPTPHTPKSEQAEIKITPANPKAPRNFNQAKYAARKIYAEKPIDFYCRCRYSGSEIDLASCDYRPRKQPKRAARLEWEHIVPAWNIGHNLQCWKDGGRKRCSETDARFSLAEADLHNLVPVVGEVNGDRSNFRFAMLPSPKREQDWQYGACRFVIDFQGRKAMPPEYTRGTIARAYLYMSQRYGINLSSADSKLYKAWHGKYPVTDWELWRNQQNACVQGNGNPYVSEVDLSLCNKKG